MKRLHKITLAIIILGTVACISIRQQKLEYPPNFIEKRMSFYDPYSSQWPDSNYTYKEWIRKPENINIAHETFKKIGYKKLLDKYYFADWSSDERPLKRRIDSLIITYNKGTINKKYYREFWTRRKMEKNDSTVYYVLVELDSILQGKVIEFRREYINDTLKNLMEIRLSEKDLTYEIARKNFEYLREVGLHQSAYNVLNERHAYYEIEWNSKELQKTLIEDTVSFAFMPWIQDNTK